MITTWTTTVYADSEETLRALGCPAAYRREHTWQGKTTVDYEYVFNFGHWPENRDEAHRVNRRLEAKAKRLRLRDVEIYTEQIVDQSYSECY